MKAVTVYNEKKGISMRYRSQAEAARVLDVDVSQVNRAVKTGQWVFALRMPVKVKRA